jgi:hypothetical protein
VQSTSGIVVINLIQRTPLNLSSREKIAGVPNVPILGRGIARTLQPAN